MRTSFDKLVAAVTFLSAGPLLLAQTAQIAGRVTDPSDAVVVDASVTVTNVNTGVVRRTSSNHQGHYAAPLLQPGTYDVLVQHEGFKLVSRDPHVPGYGIAHIVA